MGMARICPGKNETPTTYIVPNDIMYYEEPEAA